MGSSVSVVGFTEGEIESLLGFLSRWNLILRTGYQRAGEAGRTDTKKDVKLPRD